VPRIEDLNDAQRQAILNFPCFEYEDAPFIGFRGFRKPLSQARLALVTTAGLHVRGDKAFTSGDQTCRIIPSGISPRNIIQTPARLIQASAVAQRNRSHDPADELTAMRGYYEIWVQEHDGRTAVGNSSIPHRRFRGLVRFLRAIAAGEEYSYTEAPSGVPLSQFFAKLPTTSRPLCSRPGCNSGRMIETMHFRNGFGETLL
jgi:hypothetical protein